MSQRARPRLACCVALLSWLICTGCHPLEQYNTDDHVLAGPDAASPYQIRFVEFDDQGVKFSAKQLDNVVAGLSTSSRKLVVVFAHGWFHNAAPNDSNLAFFGKILGQVSGLERASAKMAQRNPRDVVGVFLGWRGASWNAGWFNYLTFWNRKDTAHRIGERAATEVIVRIQQAAYKSNSGDGHHPTRLILIGHSFGGALLYSALSQLMIKALSDDSASKLADAVLLINPAFEAARWESLATIPTARRGLPSIALLTSKSDWATGYAFPAGRALVTFVQKDRDVPNPVFAGTIDEGKANNRTVGHFQPFVTHDLRAAGEQGCTKPAVTFDEEALRKKASEEQANATQAMLDAIQTAYRAGDEPMHFGKTCLVPRKGLLRVQTNVINISADDSVWADHDFEQEGVRSERALSFLTLLVPFMGASELTPEVEQVPADAITASPRSKLQAPREELRARRYVF